MIGGRGVSSLEEKVSVCKEEGEEVSVCRGAGGGSECL